MNTESNKKTWLWVLFGVVVLVVAALAFSMGRPQSYTPYLSTSPSPTGIKGFYSFMKQEEIPVSRWNSSPYQLPEFDDARRLIMVEPYFALGQDEGNQYQEWMEQGHTIWLTKSNPVGLFNTKVEYVTPVEGITTVSNEDGKVFKANVPQTYRLSPKDSDEVVLKDSKGVLAYKRSYGQGHLLVSMNPEWIRNGEILENDHFELVLQLAEESGTSPVFIDEYIHGEKNIPTVWTLYPEWLLVLGLQSLLIILLWLWLKGKRFGPVFTPRDDVVRFGDERLQALGTWYVKGRFFKESLSIQEEYLRSLMSERWGISKTMSWDEIRHHMESRLSKKEFEKWNRWTKELDSMKEKSSIDKKSYVEWSNRLNDMRIEVQRN